MDRGRELEQTVTLEIYHSNFIVTVVTELKDLGSYLASIWRVKHARRSLDKQGGVWIRSGQGKRALDRLAPAGKLKQDTQACEEPYWLV